MRNNNIIVILASIVGLSFIGGTAKAADPQNYTEIYKICSVTPSTLPWPCSSTLAAFNKIKADPNIFANLKKNKIDDACSKAQEEAVKACNTSTTTQNTQAPKNEGTKYDVNTSGAVAGALTGAVCNKDGKDPKTGLACGGTDSTVTAKPATPKIKMSTTTGADGKTYVTVDKGDGTSYTEVKQDGKVINTIESKNNGKQNTVIDTTTKDKVTGDDKKAILTAKEAADKEKADIAKEAEKAAAKKTEELASKDPEAALAAQQKKELEEQKAATEKAMAEMSANMTKVGGEITSGSAPNTSTATQCGSASTLYKVAVDKLAEVEKQEIICKRSSGIAGFICPKANSPAVQTAATLMNASAAVLPSMSSAKDTCKYTSQFNLAGQLLLTAGSATCLVTKERCENKCGDSNINLEALKQAVQEIQATQCPVASAAAVIEGIVGHTKANALTITKCNGYKGDAEKMTVTAMNMMAAVAQAKVCEQQLSAMESTNNTAQVQTMDEMCAQAQNASSSICKCRTDNTAVGCSGYIAGSANGGNINKTASNAGAAGMASISFGSKITPNSGAASLDTNLDGLSDEAKKALAAGGDQKQDGPMFGSSGAANAGGGGGTAAGAGAAGASAGKVAEESKSIGSSFMNAVGSFFKGGSSGKTAATKEDKFAADKYKEQIKRQIAAEQMRSEISSASGVDNWSKIRTRYKSNMGSLIDSN